MTTNLPLKHYTAIASRQPDHLVGMGESWISDFNFDHEVNKERKESVRNWWMSNLYAADNLYVRNIMSFWVNYFSVHINTFHYANRAFRHLETIHTFCLGNFRDMIVDVLLKQTVIHYIKKIKPPDEKLADAVLNFILGICIAGPEHHKYISKEKMKRFRKLLNEWEVICEKAMLSGNKNKMVHHHEFIVDEFLHTPHVKGFVAELHSFIGKIFMVTPVAEHVSKKLLVWLSNKAPDLQNDHEFIRCAGNVFARSGYSIYELVDYVQTRVSSVQHDYPGGYIVTPAEFVIETVKKAGIYTSHPKDDSQNYPFYHWLHHQVLLYGQDACDIPSSTSLWNAYDLSPAQELWLDANLLIKRDRFKETIAHMSEKF